MDLSKLPSAPWHVIYGDDEDEQGHGCAGLSIGPHENDHADTFIYSQNFDVSYGPPEGLYDVFEAVVLMRNALDVQLRRRWHAQWDDDLQWVAADRRGWLKRDRKVYGGFFASADPYSCLIEADEFFKGME